MALSGASSITTDVVAIKMPTVSDAEAAFIRAKKIYIELLAAKERPHVEAITSLSDLVLRAKSISGALKETQKTRSGRWVSDFGEIANKLKPFEKLLEATCKFATKGGELVWSSVAFVLELARNNVAALDEVMEFFLTMAEEMEYIKRVVESPFNDKTLITPVIEALYVAILTFWVKAVEYYRPLKRSFFSRFRTFASSTYMAQEFQRMRVEITKHQSRVQRAAGAQHVHDSANFFQRASRRDLIKWINAPTYVVDFTAASKLRLNGTCLWMADKQEYRDLLDGKADILVVYGIPGTGKTVLSNWIIQEARSTGRSNIVLYHFFKATDDTKNHPLAAVRSFVDQLYNYLHDSQHALLPVVEPKLLDLFIKAQVEFNQLWGVFSFIISKLSESHQETTSPTVIIVVDAMDECRESSEIVRGLECLVRDSRMAGVIVTARKSGDHVKQFSSMSGSKLVVLEITSDDVHHDISSFAQHEINSMERLHDPRHADLRKNIIKRIGGIENHQGMFLWVSFMCKEIRQQFKVSDIWRLLENLPKGLNAIYASICQRLADTTSANQREFSRQVLQWIVASSRPLQFAELECALRTMSLQAAHFTHGGFFDELGDLIWSRRDVVEVCGDLVVYSGLDDGDTLRLVHLSAYHFLQSNLKDVTSSTELAAYQTAVSSFLVDVPHAQCSIARTCLFYLSSQTLHSTKYFEYHTVFLNPAAYAESKSSLAKAFPLFVYAAVYWLDYVLKTLHVTQHPGPVIPDISKLLSDIGEFIRLPSSTVWVEQCVGDMGIEYAFSVTSQLSRITHESVPNEIILWAGKICQTLESHGQTLSRVPQMVRICLSSVPDIPIPRSQVISNFALDTAKKNIPPPLSSCGIPPLEPIARGWIHYDPSTDRLFSVDKYADVMQLRCQILSTGARLCPAAVPRAEGDQGVYCFFSAAVSENTQYIAVTYEQVNPHNSKYHTICWSIVASQPISFQPRPHFAEIILMDTVTAEYDVHLNANMVKLAFQADRLLFTMCGIWTLGTLQREDGPAEIFNSVHDNVCFSEDGKHIATWNGDAKVLAVLKINNDRTLSNPYGFRLPHSVLHNLKFSPSGGKIVIMGLEYSCLKPFCIVIKVGKCIGLSLPPTIQNESWHAQCCFQFTTDEEKVVASLLGSKIVVWTLTRERGNYNDEAHMMCVFMANASTPLSAFCIVPTGLRPQLGNFESILVATDDGSISRVSNDPEYALDDEQLNFKSLSRNDLMMNMAVVERARGSIQAICYNLQNQNSRGGRTGKILRVEEWSLTSETPKLVRETEDGTMNFSCEDCDIRQLLSRSGQFLVSAVRSRPPIGRESLRLASISALSRCGKLNILDLARHPLDPLLVWDDISEAVTFDAQETRIGILTMGNCSSPTPDTQAFVPKVSVLDVKTDSDQLQIVLRAEIHFPLLQHDAVIGQLVWSQCHSELLCLSIGPRHEKKTTYLLRLVGTELISTEISGKSGDDHWQLQFSTCGGYICAVPTGQSWPKMNSLPKDVIHSSPNSIVTSHPLTMGLLKFYVFMPYIFKFRLLQWLTGIFSLDRRLVDPQNGKYRSSTYQSRTICVMPDKLRVNWNDHNTVLIWPHESNGLGVEEVKLVAVLNNGQRVVVNTGIKSNEMMNDEYWHTVTVGKTDVFTSTGCEVRSNIGHE